MPEIPLPTPETQDIFSFGFDQNLNRDTYRALSSPVVYDAIDNAINTGVIQSGGNLNVKTIESSNVERYVSPGDDLQAAIDFVYLAGGGKVYFRTGEYLITKPLFGKSGVDLIGENLSTTVMNFGSGPANLTYISSSVYTTGTITSVASGVVVTGSGTSWLTNVTPTHQLFLGNTWYKIASVDSDTQITLAEGYQGNATLPGAAYRAAIINKDVDIRDFKLQNSTGTSLLITDARSFSIDKMRYTSNNKGVVLNNVSEFLSLEGQIAVSNTSNGLEINNARLVNFYSTATPSNGGHGSVLNSFTTGIYKTSSSNSNTGDGVNATGCSDLDMQVEVASNSGQGIEFVSGCDAIQLNVIANANTSDGVKFIATNTNCKVFFSNIKNNGGYGVNVAAATNSSLIILGNTFLNNTLGSRQDLGTSTLIRSNIGTADN